MHIAGMKNPLAFAAASAIAHRIGAGSRQRFFTQDVFCRIAMRPGRMVM